MQKRHDELLTTRLEEVITKGAAFVTWSEIRLWYDAKRIAANTYRDLNDRWEKLTDQENGNLVCVPAFKWSDKENNGFWMFSDKQLKKITEL